MAKRRKSEHDFMGSDQVEAAKEADAAVKKLGEFTFARQGEGPMEELMFTKPDRQFGNIDQFIEMIENLEEGKAKLKLLNEHNAELLKDFQDPKTERTLHQMMLNKMKEAPANRMDVAERILNFVTGQKVSQAVEDRYKELHEELLSLRSQLREKVVERHSKQSEDWDREQLILSAKNKQDELEKKVEVLQNELSHQKTIHELQGKAKAPSEVYEVVGKAFSVKEERLKLDHKNELDRLAADIQSQQDDIARFREQLSIARKESDQRQKECDEERSVKVKELNTLRGEKNELQDDFDKDREARLQELSRMKRIVAELTAQLEQQRLEEASRLKGERMEEGLIRTVTEQENQTIASLQSAIKKLEEQLNMVRSSMSTVQSELEEEGRKHEDKLKTIRGRVTELESELEKKIRKHEAELRNTKTEGRTKLEEMEKKCEQAMKKAKDRCNQEMEALRAERNSEVDRISMLRTEEVVAAANRLKKVQDGYVESTTRQIDDDKARIDQLRTNYEKSLEIQKTAAEKSMEKVTELTQRQLEIESERNHYQVTANSFKSDYENEKRRTTDLEKRIETTEASLEKAQKTSRDQDETIGQLEGSIQATEAKAQREVANVKEKLRDCQEAMEALSADAKSQGSGDQWKLMWESKVTAYEDARTDLTQVQERLTRVEAEKVAAQDRGFTLETQLATLKAKMKRDAEEVDSLKSSNQTQSSTLTANEKMIDSIVKDLESEKSRAEGLSTENRRQKEELLAMSSKLTMLEGEKQSLDGQISSLQQNVADLEQGKLASQRSIEDALAKIQTLERFEADYNNEVEKRKKLDELLRTCRVAGKEVTEKANRLEKDLHTCREERERIQSTLDDTLNTSNQTIEGLNTQVTKCRESVKLFESEISNLKVERDIAKQNYESTLRRLQDKEKMMDESEKLSHEERNHLQNARNEVHSLTQQVNTVHAQNRQLQQDFENLRQELGVEHQAKVAVEAEVKQKTNNLEGVMTQWQQLRSQLNKSLEEESKARLSRDNFRQQRDVCQSRYKELAEKLERLHSAYLQLRYEARWGTITDVLHKHMMLDDTLTKQDELQKAQLETIVRILKGVTQALKQERARGNVCKETLLRLTNAVDYLGRGLLSIYGIDLKGMMEVDPERVSLRGELQDEQVDEEMMDEGSQEIRTFSDSDV